MIKTITQYVVVCDNTFCDSVVRAVVDFHSHDRRLQIEKRIDKLGWKIQEDKNEVGGQKLICPDCLLFTSELEKKSICFKPLRIKPLKKSA